MIHKDGGAEKVTAGRAIGVVRLDTDLQIVSLDETAGDLLGASPPTLLGRRIDEVVNIANLVNLMGSAIGFSNQLLSIDNRRLLCNYTPFYEEGRRGGSVLTLTLPFEQEDECVSAELNELLRSANSFMNLDYDGIIIVDRHGTVVMVNQSFADVLDSTPQAMIGKHIHQAYHNSQSSRMPIVMESAKAEIGYVHYMNGREVIASRFPLIRAGKVIGCMGKILFKDIREITFIANRLQDEATRTPPRSATGKASQVKYDINSIIGQSSKIAELKSTLLRVAGKGSNVLLRGESGTGKELCAHALHAASPRRCAPFIKVNCAAIPEHLLESELFGYAEGAFTGAKKGGQIGKFELAHGGTIFLDEIGDMPMSMQVKLLRVLQEKELTQLGSTTPKTVDVRVVAATNSNLEQLVREGKFREDLYYRVNVVALTMPPLRERKEDLAIITRKIIDQFNVEFGLVIQDLEDKAWQVVCAYDWPGNIRELRNVIESAFNVVAGPFIRYEDLPVQLSRLFVGPTVTTSPSRLGLVEDLSLSLGSKGLEEIMDSCEKYLIERALERCNGNKLQAAQLLGISRPGFYKKLQKHME